MNSRREFLASAGFGLAANVADAAKASDPADLADNSSSTRRIPMQPFPMSWRGGGSGLADMAFLLDAPAGKNGFINVSNGHLANSDGRRFRIWGVNFTAAATCPARQDSPAVAAHLAHFGLNCVRFIFLDAYAPGGLIDPTPVQAQVMQTDQLDRLDFFFAELKKRGIYSYFSLNAGRVYRERDGVRDHRLLGLAKALTYFDERLLALQREFARQLLTHYNPYTQSEYRSEPALAIVELTNENSIVESWVSDHLLGNATSTNPAVWADIPGAYESELSERYNIWLTNNLDARELDKLRTLAGVAAGAPVPRLKPAEFDSAPTERFYTEARFYMDLEESYFRTMRAYFKDDLGVKQLLVGTNDHNHSISGYPLLHSVAHLDIIDGHAYWQLTHYRSDPVTGRRGFEIENTPMVNDRFHSTVVELSRSAIAGKPFTVSETNHPFPSEYGAEGIPILAAYAAFQDWDGIFWYTFEHKTPEHWEPRQPGSVEIRPDPTKMVQIAAWALSFIRGDVRPAERVVTRSYSMPRVYESLRMPNTERPFFTPGFSLSVPLRHACRIGGFDHDSLDEDHTLSGEPIRSDTKELAWHQSGAKKGFVSAGARQARLPKANLLTPALRVAVTGAAILWRAGWDVRAVIL